MLGKLIAGAIALCIGRALITEMSRWNHPQEIKLVHNNNHSQVIGDDHPSIMSPVRQCAPANDEKIFERSLNKNEFD